MSDGRDGRRQGDDEAAGDGPTADTSGLDAGDWLAAQFEDDEDDPESDSEPGPDVVAQPDPIAEPEPEPEPEPEREAEREPEPETRAMPVPDETVTPGSFTVPPAPTAESDVVKSSGHPLALDLSALAGAVPPPEPSSETVAPAEPGVPSESDPEADAESEEPPVDDAEGTDVAAPPRWEVPQALAPRPVVVPPVVPTAPTPSTGETETDLPAADGAPLDADADSRDDAVPVAADAPHPDEPGPFTALISPPVPPEPVFPSAFDWSAPAATDDRSDADAPEAGLSAADVGAPIDQAPVEASAPAPDAQAPDVDASSADPDEQTDGDADAGADAASEVVVVAADGTVLEPVATEDVVDGPMPYGAVSSDAAAPADEGEAADAASADDESAAADEAAPADETVPADEVDEPESPEPWWVAEHHEMTRRERREAEAAGLVVPPAVPAEPAAAPVPSEAPTVEPEREPTFTELLGIVRPSSDAPETVEDTPGELSADAGRSDFVDPGPLPAGGSWALSDELADVEQSDAPLAPQHAASPVDEGDLDDPIDRDEPIDPDDPFVLLQVEPDDDVLDDDALDGDAGEDEAAATTALPVAAAAAAAAAPAVERPRTVPQADSELPGLSVEGGSATGPAAASSAAPPLARRGAPPVGPSSGGGSSATGDGAGEGIASWSRGRKVLLGVAAALVIVLALLALFLLSRSLFAGTPQPTEAPAAAVATRTVTAAPAELPREAPAGPLPAGTHPWSDLLGGECFSAFEDAWQQDYEVVDCGRPHVAQLASVGALDADPAAAYPGSDALQSQMSVLCTGGGALDLAAASTYPDAQFSASWPASDAEWTAGVRAYWCFVDRAGGEAMTTSVAPSAA